MLGREDAMAEEWDRDCVKAEVEERAGGHASGAQQAVIGWMRFEEATHCSGRDRQASATINYGAVHWHCSAGSGCWILPVVTWD